MSNLIFDKEQLAASLARITEAIKRERVLPKPPQQFDSESINVFDMDFAEPRRPWTDDQLYAYRSFWKTNLSGGGMHDIAVGINEAMNALGTSDHGVLFFERRKAGNAEVFSRTLRNGKPKDMGQRMSEEDYPMFSGLYYTHHPSDEVPLEYGYNCEGYWTFCQTLVETHFNLSPNTLKCRVLREFDPTHIELEWPERGLRFRIWCVDRLHRVDDPVMAVYAVWNIRVRAM